jgi:hypothetical protein
VILTAGHGVNDAMRRWGATLMARHNNLRRFADRGLRDITLSQLGYSTDNGAYYYYWTGDNETNYEEAMLAVVADAAQREIPYK